MRRLFRNWKLLAGVAVVAVLLAVALAPAATQVDRAPVTRGPLVVTIDHEGETRVRERFVITAPVAGRVQRIGLEPGDPVERGTTLARLTPVSPALLDVRTRAELTGAVSAAEAALGQARAERARALAALDRARTTLQRQRELAAAGVVPTDEIDARETEVRTAEEASRAAEFSVARAGHELEIARARLQQPDGGGGSMTITAPIDGVVLRRFRESEGVVPAGEPLVEIGNADRLEVVADLLSTDAVRVRAGAPVLIEQWGGDDELRGRVRRVEPSGFMKISALGVEEQRVNVIVDFEDPERAGRELGDGFRVEVRIIAWEASDVLKVPVSALFRRGDDWAVFVVEDGRAQLRIVEIGRRDGTEAQVLQGVTEGQSVIVHPPDTIADGARVAERPRGR
jgi:HlyD family secretion protein